MITLIVTPSRGPDGKRQYGIRGQLFDGRVGDWLAVERSTQPFLDAARALLAIGHDPAEPYVMKHSGSDAVALTSTVGHAASMTVAEGKLNPRFMVRDSRFDKDASAGCTSAEL